MRITRETLLKIARETAQERAQRDRGIICVYLTGSLLGDDPLLGGTADIDLVFVHDREPLLEREIVHVSDEVHVDIAHYPQTLFHQPRHLRVSPWIGPYLCANPLVLHDNHHWFEFTQASVCSQFLQPEYIFERVRTFSSTARQQWLSLQTDGETNALLRVLAYLEVIENAGNAVASFTGPPLTERRLFLQIAERAESIGRPGLAGGLSDLLFAVQPSTPEWERWLAAWSSDLETASAKLGERVPRLNRQRRRYYTRAAAALWETQPAASLWIALRIWTLALIELEADSSGLETWREMVTALGLSEDGFATRLEALDAYLDMVEEAQDSWAREYGVESNI